MNNYKQEKEAKLNKKAHGQNLDQSGNEKESADEKNMRAEKISTRGLLKFSKKNIKK